MNPALKNNIYLWDRIVGGNCPMKVETRTPFPILFVLDHKQTGKMKIIPLTQGKVTLVDNSDYKFLMQWKWHAHKDRSTYYAARGQWDPQTKKMKVIFMHRVIMQTPEDMFVDHRDHDGLHNQRKNLRNCTRSQNAKNKVAQGCSKYLGVSLIRYRYTTRNGKSYRQDIKRILYVACIQYDGVNHKIGDFVIEEDAARAYDRMAKEIHGEFANLNFKDYEGSKNTN